MPVYLSFPVKYTFSFAAVPTTMLFMRLPVPSGPTAEIYPKAGLMPRRHSDAHRWDELLPAQKAHHVQPGCWGWRPKAVRGA